MADQRDHDMMQNGGGPPPYADALILPDQDSSDINTPLMINIPTLPAPKQNGNGVSPGSLTPSQRVKSIIRNEEEDNSNLIIEDAHDLFCQMDVLCHFRSGDCGWKESSRWLKYEERVDPSNKWSKPFVTTTSVHALQAVRAGLENSIVVLNLEAIHGCVHQVMERVANVVATAKGFNEATHNKFLNVMLKPHKHQHRKGIKKGAMPHPSCQHGSEDRASVDVEPSRLGAFQKKLGVIKQALPKTEKEVSALYHTYPQGLQPKQLEPYKPNVKLMKKIPSGSEAASIMVGQVDFLTEPVFLFVRLNHSAFLGDLIEVAVPVRFIFLALGPLESTSIWEFKGFGRAAASLLTDKIFSRVAYMATSREDLLHGVDEYIDHLTVLPPSIWDPATRLDPPEITIAKEKIKARLETSSTHAAGPTFHMAGLEEADPTLKRTGRIFGGLVADIKRRYPYMLSDYRDGLHIQCLASTIFLFFACITPIITFGGLLGSATDGNMGTIETLLSGAICGIAFHAFAGQPLTIIGATGPLLVFESIVYSTCLSYDIDFLSYRFWVGIWIALFLLIIVAFDLSFLVQYITRFTEESFAVLISLIFIFEAFKIYVDSDCINEHECLEYGWILKGEGCFKPSVTHAVPDVFLFSCFLFIATFIIAYTIRMMRTSPFFPSIVRSTLGDFAVFIAVVICTGIDIAVKLDTPKLLVPAVFKTTRPDRGWVVNPIALGMRRWWLILTAALPAILAVILVFLDQQITAVIVNRKEHKLKKGHGYHLDLLVLLILIAVCSLLGLPWFVAATVRSVTHVRSLLKQSEIRAPGERPHFLGVREQRLTGVMVHVLIGLSVLVTNVLQFLPMPVLYGVFLYMGITSLGGVQFVDRILLMFMPGKFQPDHIYLRHVPTYRIHIFTTVQIICMAIMWTMKSIKMVSIVFPLMILALCFIRRLLELVFSQNEMYWLDHLLPDVTRRRMEDEGKDIELSSVRKTIDISPSDHEVK